MKLSIWNSLLFLLAATLLFGLSACGGSSSGSPSTSDSGGITVTNPGTTSPTDPITPSPGKGVLSISLTDATLYQYRAVYVTIDQVSVNLDIADETTAENHDGDGDQWQVVASPMRTVNLLELVNGILLDLGLTELDPGHYAQLRLLIGDMPDNGRNIFGNPHPYANYVIDENNQAHKLKVPSHKLKLVRGFDINAGEITELILDFDAAKSVVKAGKSGKWILKPTIKVLDTRQYAVIEGIVEDMDEPGLFLPGTLVSAQTTFAAFDEADEVKSVAATVTDELGTYKLLVAPGDYNLVAFAETYEPDCLKVAPAVGVTATGDFLLIESATGATLTGNVTVAAGFEEQPVTISVRQPLFCTDEELLVEILSDQVANGGSYSFFLPAGDYRVVSSTIDKETQAVDVSLPDGDVVVQDVIFE